MGIVTTPLYREGWVSDHQGVARIQMQALWPRNPCSTLYPDVPLYVQSSGKAQRKSQDVQKRLLEGGQPKESVPSDAQHSDKMPSFCFQKVMFAPQGFAPEVQFTHPQTPSGSPNQHPWHKCMSEEVGN